MNEEKLRAVLCKQWKSQFDIYKEYINESLHDTDIDIRKKYNLQSSSYMIPDYDHHIYNCAHIKVFTLNNKLTLTSKINYIEKNLNKIISSLYMSFIIAQENMKNNVAVINNFVKEYKTHKLFSDTDKVNIVTSEFGNSTLENPLFGVNVSYKNLMQHTEAYYFSLPLSERKLMKDLYYSRHEQFVVSAINAILKHNTQGFSHGDYRTLIKLLKSKKYEHAVLYQVNLYKNIDKILNDNSLPEFFRNELAAMQIMYKIERP